jgi:hypothetical protein
MKVQISYFNAKGEQRVKDVEAPMMETLMKKLKDIDIYQILMVSPDLADIDLAKELELGYKQFGANVNLWW